MPSVDDDDFTHIAGPCGGDNAMGYQLMPSRLIALADVRGLCIHLAAHLQKISRPSPASPRFL
ncbi:MULTISPECIES: hypothetical protein [unclassified Amycolatopsis]|uniref:hypothetical protein n=1 Tax=unclassified Amycolatopsis TaxID=2618356 RepID=UPI003452C5BD